MPRRRGALRIPLRAMARPTETRRGRRPQGPALVDSLPGSSVEKQRLAAILATLAGEVTIEEACARVGLSSSRFFELRERALEAALEALVPRLPGRPVQVRELDAQEHEALRRENRWLKEEVQISRTRVELALLMPELFAERVGKWPARAQEGRSGGPSGATTRGSRRSPRPPAQRRAH
jgi:transposase-like protein